MSSQLPKGTPTTESIARPCITACTSKLRLNKYICLHFFEQNVGRDFADKIAGDGTIKNCLVHAFFPQLTWHKILYKDYEISWMKKFKKVIAPARAVLNWFPSKWVSFWSPAILLNRSFFDSSGVQDKGNTNFAFPMLLLSIKLANHNYISYQMSWNWWKVRLHLQLLVAEEYGNPVSKGSFWSWHGHARWL